ncbi:Imidazoleglycerol-phosphate dehydratase OS=Streptomyces fumanus OX=67302 GN=hisB PE=3 SV=1 [Streptomyces fumanus]
MSRVGRVERVTKETSVLVEIDLDGTGKTDIATGVGFYDHMLDQLGRHGLFDLTVRTEGDLHIDCPTTPSRTPPSRWAPPSSRPSATRWASTASATAQVPLDESLAQVTVDLSGRPYLVHTEPETMAPPMIGEYDVTMTRHIPGVLRRPGPDRPARARALRAQRPPHPVECQFKALARALRYACERDPRAAGILPSTKGAL